MGINPHTAKHEYNRSYSVLLADQITDIWERNECLNLVSNLTNMNNVHPFEVVGRGSEVVGLWVQTN